MGGVGPLTAGSRGRGESRRRTVPDQIELTAQLAGIPRTEQALQGNGHLVGIAEPLVAVAVGQVHRLHQGVDAGGAVQPPALQRQRLEDLQQLQQRDATTARRRHAQHAHAAKAGAQGRHKLGLIGVEISLSDQAAPRPHQLHQGLGAGAAIKPALATIDNAAQAGGQLGLAQQLPRPVGPRIPSCLGRRLEEQLARGRVGLQQRRRLTQGAAQFGAHGKAKLGQRYRRRHDPDQGQAAVAALGQQQAGGRARHGGAEQAAGGPLAVDLAPCSQKHSWSSGQGSCLAEVHRHSHAAADRQLGSPLPRPGVRKAAPLTGRRRARQPEHRKAAAAQVAGLGQGDRQGKGRGHRRIHGVAPLAQHCGAGFRGQPLLARHHPTGRPLRLEALAPFLQGVGQGGQRLHHQQGHQGRNRPARAGAARTKPGVNGPGSGGRHDGSP